MRFLTAFLCFWALIWSSGAFADDSAYTGPFYMCPDAHGAEQKSLFRIIDITRMPVRIEGMSAQRVDGFAASLAASRSAQIMNKKDPIQEAFEKLAGITTTMATDNRRLVAVCFATTPPPKTDADGPFLFMPGYLIKSQSDVLQPLDTVTVPAQTYLVLTYEGPSAAIGDMRFTMSEEFWPKVAPFLGLERTDGPNLMIWAPGLKGNEPNVSLEFWTPIKPYRVAPRLSPTSLRAGSRKSSIRLGAALSRVSASRACVASNEHFLGSWGN